jgi:hypothetical protein
MLFSTLGLTLSKESKLIKPFSSFLAQNYCFIVAAKSIKLIDVFEGSFRVVKLFIDRKIFLLVRRLALSTRNAENHG